jgi:hypothetical protein
LADDEPAIRSTITKRLIWQAITPLGVNQVKRCWKDFKTTFPILSCSM